MIQRPDNRMPERRERRLFRGRSPNTGCSERSLRKHSVLIAAWREDCRGEGTNNKTQTQKNEPTFEPAASFLTNNPLLSVKNTGAFSDFS